MRRLVVRLVRAGLPLLGDVLNIATTNGLDLGRELGAITKSEAKLTPDNVLDFLSLMDSLTRDVGPSVPPDQSRVRTSILMCVHNHADYTLQSLRALLPQIDLKNTEIILINNASTDETDRLLFHLARTIEVVNNTENVGFVKACNQGAAIARGEYLVFLNNCTVVHADWLSHLIETVESDDAIGAVGSMLLYPDGQLQEAGGIVGRDGSAGSYGRGEDPTNHKFGFAREVDYCSATSLLVRRDLFFRIGGFDERYAPAYYEDADLCFGIHSLGFKVMYQPLARVSHWEATTRATDPEKGWNSDQTLNRRKFAEKWQVALRSKHIANGQGLQVSAADRRRGPRIVVFDNGLPTPDRDSGSQRMFMILQLLAKIGRPAFVAVNQPPVPEYQALLGKHGIEVVPRIEYKSLLGSDCDLVILSRVSVADEIHSSVRRINKSLKIVFDTVDIHSLRLERECGINGNQAAAREASLRRKQELRLTRASDQVWCVTENDRNVLKKEVPQASIRVIPNIHTLHSRGAAFAEREGLLFIGSFLHRPNLDALDYFVRTISPLLSQSLQGVKLYVVGSYITDQVKAFASESVIILGHAPNVDDLFHHSRLFVAPLRFGSGMKGKIGQAMSYGLPVITSSIGAEGFEFKDGHDVMIADEPEAFAEAIVRAYEDKDLWQQLSDNGYQHIHNHLTPHVVNKKIVNAISELFPILSESVSVTH
jgi:GT2 family glycosyltransferase/glycosyltransferase involved in cell wall biosynthesis